MNKQYVMYVRKSQDRDDRQVASIDDQLGELKSLAERRGLKIVKIFNESRSAKKPGRPVFNEMIKYIKHGHADGLLCWKLNRVARNALDAGEVTQMLQSGILKHIASSERDYHPTDNVLMILIDFGIATQYSKDLSTDIQRGMRYKANQGWMPISMLPIGYLHNAYKEKKEEIIPDPNRFKLVRELWQLFLTNAYSLSEIKRIADRRGLTSIRGTSFARSSLRRMFSSPFYCGYFYWKNSDGDRVRLEGRHKPMITELEFNRVQTILAHRSRKSQPRGYDFAYRGFITCGACESTVTAERKKQAICTRCKTKFSILHTEVCISCELPLSKMKDPIIIQHVYYGCANRKSRKCTQKFINEKTIEQSIIDALGELEIYQEMYDWMKVKLKNAEPFGEDVEVVIESLKSKKRNLQRKMDRLLEMRINDEISQEEASNIHTRYGTDLNVVSNELIEKQHANESRRKENKSSLDLALNCVERFKNASILDKKIIIQKFTSNLTLHDKTLYFSTKKPLSAVLYQE
jgi:site-specific DNA recombinase